MKKWRNLGPVFDSKKTNLGLVFDSTVFFEGADELWGCMSHWHRGSRCTFAHGPAEMPRHLQKAAVRAMGSQHSKGVVLSAPQSQRLLATAAAISFASDRRKMATLNHMPSGVPPCSLLLSKNYRDFEASSFGILVFRGTWGSIWPNFGPLLTDSDLFCRAGPTYFHLFRPISPCGPDLFSPISFHNKAPWTGHLNMASSSPIPRTGEKIGA